MKRKKVLITGGSGFLGQHLNIELSKDFDIFTLFNQNPGNCTDFKNAIADIKNHKVLETIFSKIKPDVVVHTACYSNPEICNRLPKEEVLKLNVDATEDIANLCRIHNADLIFTSTDLVYESSSELKIEESPLQSKSLYAETKIMAEQKIKDSAPNYIILRTSLLYGIGLNHTQSHFESMLVSLENNEQVSLFNNQYRTPLEVREAAQIISQLIKKQVKNEIINFGGKEKISRYEMGELSCDIFEFDKKNLVKKNGEELLRDLFVKDVSMNTDKLKSYGIEQNTVRDSIEKIKRDSSLEEPSLDEYDVEDIDE